MLPTANPIIDKPFRRRATLNWRQATDNTPLLPSNLNDILKNSDNLQAAISTMSYGQRLLTSTKFKSALIITVTIILVQLFIVNHYLGSSLFRVHRKPLTKEDLSSRFGWFCLSFPHLNRVQELASKHHVELVIVDADLLTVLGILADGDGREVEFSESNLKSHQGPSQQKSIIHLAALNETSGGQPNLKSFYKALKNNSYVTLKYEDASETMPHEIYRRKSHQFDDVQADALRDLNHLEQVQPRSDMVSLPDIEISKIYTEFIAHIFILNGSRTATEANGCGPSSMKPGKLTPFVVIHIFVLYNYEYEPDKMWLQSSLRLDEIERHKLLTYGVHSIDFRVPIDHYYIHDKRATIPIREAAGAATFKESIKDLKVFDPQRGSTLEFANNTYLHCKPSSFNMSGLMDGHPRKMSNYLKLLDSAKPLRASPFRASLDEQLHIAFRFMDVFSKTYANFSYWATGSSLLAYHKFCELVVMPSGDQLNKFAPESYDESLGSDEPDDESDFPSDVIVNLELGLFADELNTSMLQDLSNAKMIGVTMISDWRKPNSHISFHVRDCPNLIFNLYLYELRRDFYQHYFITRDNLTFNHKFRRKLQVADNEHRGPTNVGHHVFGTSNLRLCWTRINRLHPFRVPCDVHDHLRRIYII